MTVYNIAICDDEIKTLENLTTIIENKFLALNIEGSYFTTTYPEELLEILDKEKIDVLFLDIDMPKISGMDIGQYLLNKSMDTLLIFVTSHDALVYESFKYHPFGFIRKSHLEDEISQVVQSVAKKLDGKKESLFIKVNNEVIKINLNDILYFEGESNYVNLYTSKEKYRFRETLGNLEKQLANKGFLRVHKGYLISQREVFLIKAKEVKLQDGTLIPIGRSYSENVKKELMKYMR
ncbi:MAG: LytTR family DNA-binding domain-containing protein [Bacillota bacterium]|nr:LytTR family DNA-binding domain-containing protein [Bacillota bacterium]